MKQFDMWKRFSNFLCCPLCHDSLELAVFDEASMEISEEDINVSRERGLFEPEFNRFVYAGLLLCDACKKCYPITEGLPVLIPYMTATHEEFADTYKVHLARFNAYYKFPNNEPVQGERFVMDSFSREWLPYKYDGIIWEMNYEDHEKRFLNEMGLAANEKSNLTFLEVGCGVGITTCFANKNYRTDSVGVDLSLAVINASKHYKNNPFLHFVQASVFYLPFKRESFDMVYSRGVLHHTFSTHDAFRAVASYCRPGGLLYVWVYGTKSIKSNVFRRVAYLAEALVRPALSQRPYSRITDLFLGVMAVGYMGFNTLRRIRSTETQKYNFKRALHAARDRFTPRYAFRHTYPELAGWFTEAGFDNIEVLDWRAMPPADKEDYRRNIGVRGKRTKQVIV